MVVPSIFTARKPPIVEIAVPPSEFKDSKFGWLKSTVTTNPSSSKPLSGSSSSEPVLLSEQLVKDKPSMLIKVAELAVFKNSFLFWFFILIIIFWLI